MSKPEPKTGFRSNVMRIICAMVDDADADPQIWWFFGRKEGLESRHVARIKYQTRITC